MNLIKKYHFLSSFILSFGLFYLLMYLFTVNSREDNFSIIFLVPVFAVLSIFCWWLINLTLKSTKEFPLKRVLTALGLLIVIIVLYMLRTMHLLPF
jgi:hypothetical protein